MSNLHRPAPGQYRQRHQIERAVGAGHLIGSVAQEFTHLAERPTTREYSFRRSMLGVIDFGDVGVVVVGVGWGV